MGQRLTVNSFTFATLLVQQKTHIEVNGIHHPVPVNECRTILSVRNLDNEFFLVQGSGGLGPYLGCPGLQFFDLALCEPN
jgi:hypothetical protein